LYCAACKRKFKSDAQWKNHEKSRKHLNTIKESGVIESVHVGKDSKLDEDSEEEDEGTIEPGSDEEEVEVSAKTKKRRKKRNVIQPLDFEDT